jgi:hypothetical protein
MAVDGVIVDGHFRIQGDQPVSLGNHQGIDLDVFRVTLTV